MTLGCNLCRNFLAFSLIPEAREVVVCRKYLIILHTNMLYRITMMIKLKRMYQVRIKQHRLVVVATLLLLHQHC